MDINNRFQYWLIWGLIRSGILRKVAVSASEVNEILEDNLPTTYPLSLNWGKGELNISHATVDFPSAKPGYFRATLKAALNVSVASIEVYRSHLNIVLSGAPLYQPDEECLRVKNVSVDEVKLVKDSYALMASANSLFQTVVPSPFTHLMNVAVETSMGVVSDVLGEDLQNYFVLYQTGSMQRVLDYHQPQIEATLIEECKSGELFYQLQDELLDERLFINLGKGMEVKDQTLFCLF